MTKRTNDILTKLQSVLSEDNKELLEELLQTEYDQGFDDGYESGKSDYMSEASDPEPVDPYEDETYGDVGIEEYSGGPDDKDL